MSISPGAAYVRQVLSTDGSVSLLPNEHILSAAGDLRGGFVLMISGTGPVPKDAATVAARPPVPPPFPTTAPFPVLPDA